MSRRWSVTNVIGDDVKKAPVDAAALEAVVPPKSFSAAFDADSTLEKHYKPIAEYEGYHRYDPSFTWTHEEEKKIVRKVFLHSLPISLLTVDSHSLTD